ncbi:MAG: membrane protein insertase YidC [Pseudomonadota bacterium]
MPQQDESRNTIAFILIAFVLLIGYQFLVVTPANKKRQDEAKAKAAASATATPEKARVPVAKVPREAARAASPARVEIRTPAMTGSINLKGGRIDDLFLTERVAGKPNRYRYAETTRKNSPPVEIFRPEGAEHAWFAEFGWSGQNLPGLPDTDTVWTLTEGETLAPGKPVVLTYVTPGRLVFTRRISVDERFMFTVTDTVANLGAAPVTLSQRASIQRIGLPAEAVKNDNVHKGAVGGLADTAKDEGVRLRLLKYPAWKKDAAKALGPVREFASTGGWLGITDKYWLAALAPEQTDRIVARYGMTPGETAQDDRYAAGYFGAAHLIPPGKQATETTRLFAGAKVVQDLKAYQKALGVARFEDAVDWGVLSFLTKPFFAVLELFFGFVKNFGLAILGVTLVVRILLFPLAHKSYESMSRMKKLQKPMEEIRARFKDDPAKMQQETMALYQREKVNPLAGCLPLLLQIPIFLAFYKVLSVTIEMRHAPFYGYIHDLSSRDPATIFNLFGLIPWDPATTPLIGGLLDGYLHLGPLALLYGFTMWLTTSMNPPAPDPTQQRIFQMMPILFTFIMAGFPAGLLIYWTFSNVFSIFQQYILMHRMGTENPIDSFIARVRGATGAS